MDGVLEMSEQIVKWSNDEYPSPLRWERNMVMMKKVSDGFLFYTIDIIGNLMVLGS